MEAKPPAGWRGYSEEERDRRWRAVRANARAAGLDCILVPLCLDRLALRIVPDEPSATGANGRYLTQLDGAVVILPTDHGLDPIVITERRASNSWLPETRTSGRGWNEPIVQALLETGMERGLIGVVGLRAGKYSHPNAADGVVVHSALADVAARLPDATFRDATDVVGLARYQKGDEEIACVRRAVDIADQGIQALREESRPGISEATLYARIMSRLLASGSEYVPLVLSAGPHDRVRYRHVDPQPGHILQAGWAVEADVFAMWGGLIACETQTVVLGPVPEPYLPLVDAQRAAWSAAAPAFTPGHTMVDVFERLRNAGSPGDLLTDVMLRGCGYGDDGPRIGPEPDRDGLEGIRLERGSVWTCKLSTHAANNEIRFVWGTTVLATADGGALLSPRPPTILSV